MKSTWVLIFMLFAFILAVNPEGKFKKTELEIGKEKFAYHVVNAGSEAVFNLAAGTINTILVRLVEGAEATLWLGDKEPPQYIKWVQDSASGKVKWNKKVVSKAYKYVIRTQKKSKTAFKIEVTKGTALVRVNQKSTIPYITMAPKSSAGEITTIAKELKTSYWRISSDTPAVYTIKGKGKIELFSRLIYTHELMGTQRYSIWIEINGNKSLYEFETNPSEVAYLEGFPDLKVGVARKVKLTLPENKNTIKITPRGSEKVIVRLSVPKTMIDKKAGKK